jgi:hypothetical protein
MTTCQLSHLQILSPAFTVVRTAHHSAGATHEQT